MSRAGVVVRDAANERVERPVRETALSGALIGKGGHPHFMKKEIFEQPAVIGDTLNAYVNPATRNVVLPPLPFVLAAVPKITILACGTAYHAGLIAKYWIERVARLSVEVDVASEFRYREAALAKGGLTILVSQSGETADTLASLRYAKAQGQHILSVVNQPESTIARESDVVLGTYAGPEIGVASTKAFTTQLAVLACFAIALGAGARHHRPGARSGAVGGAGRGAGPGRPSAQLRPGIAELAVTIAEARDVLYLGRGTSYPLGARRRTEAQGDFLHPRRRLCRRRDEARADRIDRRRRFRSS